MTPTDPDVDLRQVLQERFGFDAFRPGQEEVMGTLLAGRSAAAVFPTGGGKSICYQLPALLLPGLTLVVSPLIALMKDQIDQLTARDIPAARLDSSIDREEFRRVSTDIRSGALKLLYVAPERFNNERFRETLRQQRISLMAIDEAHCISEWGHNFRPDYLKLAGYARMCRAERILALTATAPPKVLSDICAGFDIAENDAVRTGFFRPNLTLLASRVDAAQRDAALAERLQERDKGPTIVYVTLQKTAELVAERLQALGFDAKPYHAGMSTEERTATQDWFIASGDAIVVATIAFGMGIDKSDIRYVYHYNPPKSLENLSQEIGRAGRDGEPAICEQLICEDDLQVIRNFACGDTPSRDAVASFLRDVLAPSAEPRAFNLVRLGNDHDIRSLVVRTLLTYLELDGLIELGTAIYNSYRFKPLVPSAEMLSHFQGERRDFLKSVLRQSKKAKTWFSIDLDESSQALGQPRRRLVAALDYLAEKGWLELSLTDVRYPIRCLQDEVDLEALADSLQARTVQHESRELERFEQVLDLVTSDFCRWYRLSDYFGEDLGGPCDNCSFCFDGESFELKEPEARNVPAEIWQDLRDLTREQAFLREPRAATRFLIGLSSPRLSRARLSKHRLFGILADVPFTQLLTECEHSLG